MHSYRKFEFANALRGPAALCVVASHLLGNVMPSWQLPMQLLGQIGVAVFFLVSGFVIPISLIKYDSGAFLVARMVRIYPTYAVALTITLAVLWVQGQPLGNDDLRYVSNYLIMGVVFNEPAFDDVVWTLQIELHFYLLCVVIAPMIREFRLAVLAASFAIYIAELAAYWSGFPLAIRLAGGLPFLLFMFGGVSAFYFVNRKISAGAMVGYCFGCFWLFFLAWWFSNEAIHLAPNYATQLAPSYAAGAGIFLAALFWRRHVPASRINSFFCRISYSLYVIHTGVGVWVLRLMISHSYPAYAAVTAGFAAAVAVATIVHVAVEAPTHHLGQRLAQAISCRTQSRFIFRSRSHSGA
jgi:peptidoglycan/LPS O-acetylase OafA/YrhL